MNEGVRHMKPLILGAILTVVSGWNSFAQSTEALPQFEAADVHSSAKVSNPFPRSGPARGGRYEIKTATMLDLVRMAHGFDADKILGGPNWLELDRYDMIAKLPPEST